MRDIEKIVFDDSKYESIIDNIIRTDEFQSLKKINQHGTTRYLHSLRVSYYSYLIAKTFKLDTIAVARAGLLHDFFFLTTTDCKKIKNKMEIFSFEHGIIAASNANKLYKINKKEKNIIESHMFPFCKKAPKYKESILVNWVDNYFATIEFFIKWKYQVLYIPNLLLILAINKLFS